VVYPLTSVSPHEILAGNRILSLAFTHGVAYAGEGSHKAKCAPPRGHEQSTPGRGDGGRAGRAGRARGAAVATVVIDALIPRGLGARPLPHTSFPADRLVPSVKRPRNARDADVKCL